MRLPNVQITDTILAKFTKLKPEEMRSGILVPVNSSANAFNSLEYALNLAKILKSTIHLFYVIDVDVDELSESTIVAHRILERTYRKAESCVESLKEMIEESGVTVLTAESKIGNIELLIQRQIEYIRPGMIVIGRDCFTASTINSLISQSTCPLISVPGSSPRQLPSSILLTNEHNIFSEKSLNILIKIIQSTTQELTILKFIKFKKNRFEKVAVPHAGADDVLVSLNYQQIKKAPSANTVNDFVRANGVDLVCSIHQKQSFFKRFLGRSFSADIVFSLNIPVMTMREF
ncbi:MAG TPA: universal stress protein [Chryseolinea sp.]